MSESCLVCSAFLVFLSQCIGLGLMITLVVFRYRDSRKFEYVWICSKIKTIKNIVKENSFDKQIFDSISPKGKVISLSTTYYDLLKLNTESGCKNGYRQCGILDTFGNKLCIDSTYPCPINSIISDLTSKRYDYINKGYNVANLKRMSYNYDLYFSNELIVGNATISMIKAYYKPKFINYNNFILDTDAFQETFGSLKLPENSNINYNIDKNKTNDDIRRRLSDDDNVDVGKLASDIISSLENGINSLILYSNAKSLLKFMDYLEEKLEIDENNDDKYYTNIGDNYYVKNYIGFRNNEELDQFLNFEFSFHERLFPNKISGIFAIICLVIFFILFIINIVALSMAGDRSDKDAAMVILIVSFIINLIIFLGFLIYSITIYKDVYNNKDLLILNTIKSDDFINGFIKEYISIFNKKGVILATICTIPVAILLEIIGIISFCVNL